MAVKFGGPILLARSYEVEFHTVYRKTIRLETMADEYALPLSTRSINFLFEYGILTADALAKADLAVIENIRGVGRQTITELQESQQILRRKLHTPQ